MTSERRIRAHVWGLRAETLAALFLTFKGYRVLARRFAVAQGEVDVIARRGDVVAFVEVKAREDFDAALDALTPQKVRRISTAARVWLGRNPWAAGFTLRGDLAIVVPRGLPRHLPDAYSLRLS